MPRLILRPALHSALLDALDTTTVEVNRAALRFETDGSRVRLELADGTIALGDILVGADGAGSTVRGQLHPTEPPAHPSGYFAVRGVSPAVERLNGLQAIWYLGPGVEAALVQASSNAIYWFVSLLADDVGPGPLNVDSVMRRCTAGFDRHFQAIAGASFPGDMRLDDLLARDPLEQWGTGCVTLLGDAAHPMLPHTGQGAAQALEDAVALGRVMKGNVDHVAALRRYQAVRVTSHTPVRENGAAHRADHDDEEPGRRFLAQYGDSTGSQSHDCECLHAGRSGPVESSSRGRTGGRASIADFQGVTNRLSQAF